MEGSGGRTVLQRSCGGFGPRGAEDEWSVGISCVDMVVGIELAYELIFLDFTVDQFYSINFVSFFILLEVRIFA